jgi:molecular chaperone GrpE
LKEDQVHEENSTAQETPVEPETASAHEAEPGEGAAEQTAGETAQSGPESSRLQELAEEYQGRVLRVQADFDNFRRRTLKEKEELAQYATAKLVTELLPVLDNFERALATAPDAGDAEAFTKGVGMIFRQLDGVLKAEGVQAMETVGQPFNPEFHQAIMQVESDEYEEGIVTEEVQKGYLLKDKVLRPAMVKVSM